MVLPLTPSWPLLSGLSSVAVSGLAILSRFAHPALTPKKISTTLPSAITPAPLKRAMVTRPRSPDSIRLPNSRRPLSKAWA